MPRDRRPNKSLISKIDKNFDTLPLIVEVTKLVRSLSFSRILRRSLDAIKYLECDRFQAYELLTHQLNDPLNLSRADRTETRNLGVTQFEMWIQNISLSRCLNWKPVFRLFFREQYVNVIINGLNFLTDSPNNNYELISYITTPFSIIEFRVFSLKIFSATVILKIELHKKWHKNLWEKSSSGLHLPCSHFRHRPNLKALSTYDIGNNFSEVRNFSSIKISATILTTNLNVNTYTNSMWCNIANFTCTTVQYETVSMLKPYFWIAKTEIPGIITMIHTIISSRIKLLVK